MCFYFVFTVFVTVGFGDIAASNTSERVLLLLLLLLQLPLLQSTVLLLHLLLCPSVDERLRRAYPALPERAGVGSISANSDTHEMKLSPFYFYAEI